MLKHPSINQLNFDFDLPIQVTNYAKKEGIALVSHSDDLGKLASAGAAIVKARLTKFFQNYSREN